MEGGLKQDSNRSADIPDTEEAAECSSPPCLMREFDRAYFWFTPENPSESDTPCCEAVPVAPAGRADEAASPER